MTDLLVRIAVWPAAVHLADQNRPALIVALAQQPELGVAETGVLPKLTSVGHASKVDLGL
ncbi:hypothetical protein [Streptomyces sp. gb14]|uniref:hypothetical protein n=1 Tax=Streptomyces sp. gb14 TaxID=1827753 RepID=UPI000BF16397|nr:hypothetical protein [Streptomyces sp. gb14]